MVANHTYSRTSADIPALRPWPFVRPGDRFVGLGDEVLADTRRVEQARASFPTAHALGVEVQVAVHLDVTCTELVRRLLARRGSEDTEAVIERRLQVCLDKTVPLLEY